MSTPNELESKIIKQVEYYFGDLNLSRDKFMKEVTSANDGWISFETMLKFNRLKCLSEDVDVIRNALLKATSGLLEIGPNGVRRNPEFAVPSSFDEAFAAYKDRSVYVKGFNTDASLDEIIEWLELHGGKTLNVHLRRLPKDKKFKGSIFAIFEKKEDADKFLASEEAAVYKGNNMIRMMREDYWSKKKGDLGAQIEARTAAKAAAKAVDEEKLAARMLSGALLELSNLPKSEKDQTNVKPADDKEQNGSTENDKSEKSSETEKESDALGGLTVLALKQWLNEKLADAYPIAWIDVEPAEGKAVVRFRAANSAEAALAKLKQAFNDGPVIYANCELSGRVLSGEEELAHWRTVYAAQQQKSQRRTNKRQNNRGGPNKKRRFN